MTHSAHHQHRHSGSPPTPQPLNPQGFPLSSSTLDRFLSGITNSRLDISGAPRAGNKSPEDLEPVTDMSVPSFDDAQASTLSLQSVPEMNPATAHDPFLPSPYVPMSSPTASQSSMPYAPYRSIPSERTDRSGASSLARTAVTPVTADTGASSVLVAEPPCSASVVPESACEQGASRCSCMHVVIVGAGLAGVSVATMLARRLGPHTSTTISLVDPRDYVEIRWAVIRALFDPSIMKQCVMSLHEGLSRYPCIRHVRARVTAMSYRSLTLKNGDMLPFDVCLLATGSIPHYSLLSAPEQCVKARREQLLTEGRRLCNAPSVLIVGGGPVGAELAGYLAVHAKSRKRAPRITLIHHGNKLCEPLGPRASDKLAHQLRGLGVEVILGESAAFCETKKHWVIKSTGRVLDCAEVVTPTGVQATPGGAGDLIRKLGKLGREEVVDQDGWVRTDRFGRVGKQVSPNNTIFALGDCTHTPYKSGVTIVSNRKNMAHNLHTAVDACMAARRGQEFYVEKKLKIINEPSTSSVAVLAGPAAGVVQTRFFVDDMLLPTWRARTTMSLSKVRSDIGL